MPESKEAKNSRKIRWRRAQKARLSQMREVRTTSQESAFQDRLFLYEDDSPVGTGQSVLTYRNGNLEQIVAPPQYDDIGDSPVEYMRLYDTDGNVVPIMWGKNGFGSFTTNDEYEIDIPATVYNQFQNRVFVHNHPNSLSFSPQDWGLFDLGMAGMTARSNRNVFWRQVQDIQGNRNEIYRAVQNARSANRIDVTQRRAFDFALDFIERLEYDSRRPAVDYQIRVDKKITRKQSQQYEREFEDLQLSMIGMLSGVPRNNRLFIVNHAISAALAEKYGFQYSVTGT